MSEYEQLLSAVDALYDIKANEYDKEAIKIGKRSIMKRLISSSLSNSEVRDILYYLMGV